MVTTHYGVLCAARGDSRETVHRLYRALARALHPDHGGDPERMRAVIAAWAVLSDPPTRAKYDLSLDLRGPACGCYGGRDWKGALCPVCQGAGVIFSKKVLDCLGERPILF